MKDKEYFCPWHSMGENDLGYYLFWLIDIWNNRWSVNRKIRNQKQCPTWSMTAVEKSWIVSNIIGSRVVDKRLAKYRVRLEFKK